MVACAKKNKYQKCEENIVFATSFGILRKRQGDGEIKRAKRERELNDKESRKQTGNVVRGLVPVRPESQEARSPRGYVTKRSGNREDERQST